MLRFSKLLLAMPLLVQVACTARTTHENVETSPGYFAEPADFIGINFKPGRPAEGENLTESLTDDGSREALSHDLVLLTSFPAKIPLRVVGYTDSKECTGVECIYLSRRRASALHAWFVAHGVPASRFTAPIGFGAARPIRDNATEEGRAMNRRGYISYEGW
jgi:OOP family OmpA-OmpF porin